ncbi:MAG: hypothetical protein HQL66_00315 [Magnetococcales bacterium]|nr:hypothetical protein [Magnetococcales bacterium]
MIAPGSVPEDTTPSHFWLVGTISLIVGVSFGLSFGDASSNHSIYLLSGMRQANPTLWRGDWFVEQVPSYHLVFNWLVAWLHGLGILPAALALGNVVAVSFTLGIVHATLRLVEPRLAFPAWCGVVLSFFLLYQTFSVGLSYFFSYSLQPSSLSITLFLASMYAFACGRQGWAGLLWAGAGLFHTNYLLLGFPFFGLAYIVRMHGRIFDRNLLRLLLPPLAVLVAFVPMILQTVGSTLPPEQEREAERIFFSLSFFHYLPSYFAVSFIPFLGWIVAGVALSQPRFTLSRINGHHTPIGGLASLYISGLTVITMGTLLTTVVFLPMVARLFVWRLAPIVLLMSQGMVVLWLVRLLFGTHAPSDTSWRAALLATLGILAVLGFAFVLPPDPVHWYWPQGHDPALQPLALTLLPILPLTSTPILACLPWGRRILPPMFASPKAHRILLWMFLPALLVVLNLRFEPRHMKFDLVNGFYDQQRDRHLLAWAASTPVGTRFLVSPGYINFRLRSGRAVVVDWQSIPHQSDHRMEWYRRLLAVTNRAKLEGTEDFVALGTYYHNTPLTRMQEVACRYAADYIVRLRRQNMPPEGDSREIAYQDATYLVYRLAQPCSYTGLP